MSHWVPLLAGFVHTLRCAGARDSQPVARRGGRERERERRDGVEGGQYIIFVGNSSMGPTLIRGRQDCRPTYFSGTLRLRWG